MDFRVVRSRTAKKLRLRVGLDGVEVVQPHSRSGPEVFAFLEQHRTWVFDQMARIERLRVVRRPQKRSRSEILFRGEPTRVRIARFGDPAASDTGPTRVLRRDQAEKRHQLAWVLKPSDVADFGHEANRRDKRDPA